VVVAVVDMVMTMIVMVLEVEEEEVEIEIEVVIEVEVEGEVEEDLTIRTQNVSTVMVLAIGHAIVPANVIVVNATTAVNSDIKLVIARRDLVPHHTIAAAEVEVAAPKEEVLEVQDRRDRREDLEVPKKAEAEARVTAEAEVAAPERALPVETIRQRVDLALDLVLVLDPRAKAQSRNPPVEVEVEAEVKVQEKARALNVLDLPLLINH